MLSVFVDELSVAWACKGRGSIQHRINPNVNNGCRDVFL